LGSAMHCLVIIIFNIVKYLQDSFSVMMPSGVKQEEWNRIFDKNVCCKCGGDLVKDNPTSMTLRLCLMCFMKMDQDKLKEMMNEAKRKLDKER